MDTSGWIDIQINGYGGVDFSTPELTLDAVRTMTQALKEKGTSAYCPTFVTSSPEMYERNLPILARAMREPDLKEHIPGIHIEGPFLSPVSRGAHQENLLAAPSIKMFEEWQKLAEGGIKILTLAPETEGAPAFIKHVVAQGVVISLGHHMADDDSIARAVDAGATLCTHLGNGIANTLPRHPNPIWTQLADDRLNAGFIPDGHHLPDSFLRVAWRAKGRDRFIATSDAAAIAGLPPGPYSYMGNEVELETSGRIVIRDKDGAGTATLAGSGSTLADCMAHLAKLGDWTPDDLLQVGRRNPARILGVSL